GPEGGRAAAAQLRPSAPHRLQHPAAVPVDGAASGVQTETSGRRRLRHRSRRIRPRVSDRNERAGSAVRVPESRDGTGVPQNVRKSRPVREIPAAEKENMTARGAADTAKVDILIPCAPKDVRTLPFAINAARKHVRHPIGRIYVVAPRNRRIKAVCRRKNVSFVDERRVLPFSKNRYRYRTKTRELSGWLYQQLLKLSGDRVCRAGHFLVL